MEEGKVFLKKKDDRGKADADAAEMKVLVSGVLHHEGKTFVRVSFLRGKDWAEGIVPDGVIERSEGFSGEEIGKLETYLAAEKEMFIRQAKGVNPIRNLFRL